MGSIPIYSEDYINESNNLTQEQIEKIMFPEVLPPLVAPENNRNLITSLHPVQQAKETAVRDGASVCKVIEHPLPRESETHQI